MRFPETPGIYYAASGSPFSFAGWPYVKILFVFHRVIESRVCPLLFFRGKVNDMLLFFRGKVNDIL